MPEPRGDIDPDALAAATARAVATALDEDLGGGHDLTSAATVAADARGSADIVARADGVLAGIDVATAVFAAVDDGLDVQPRRADGAAIEAGDLIATVNGPLRAILTAERTALNFLGHLSGVATLTRRFVAAVEDTGCVIRDTRKTLPGLRLLEKAAVVAGGGANHRAGLHDALLVKDNHVAAAGDVARATTAALASADGRPVQVEVTSLAELDEALAAGADDILLDNFHAGDVAEAVARTAGRATLEASGTITLETVRAYAGSGVDRIAVGVITHSAPQLDIALDVHGGA